MKLYCYIKYYVQIFNDDDKKNNSKHFCDNFFLFNNCDNCCLFLKIKKKVCTTQFTTYISMNERYCLIVKSKHRVI